MATINGTAGNDTLNDLAHIGGITYDPGTDDVVNGLAGSDLIEVHNGNDTVNGGEDGDAIYDYGTGNDLLRGEAGNDFFFVGQGYDTIDGGSGTDSVSYLFSQQIVALDLATGFAISEGIDTLVSIEDAYGGPGNDILMGNDGPNQLGGGDGNDRLEGRGGNDLLYGLYGNDVLAGGDGDDMLYGYFGDDTLDGGNGNDLLWGFWGNDAMTGGPGADRFYFTSFNDFPSLDIITDFQHGMDKIDLRGIDARPDLAGDQAFTFDSTPDGGWEEFFDGLSDDWNIIDVNDTGPTINGDTGEIEYRHDGGYTYVFLATGDGVIDASIRLDGTVTLTAADFLL